eukprot:6458857-Amphidinium_carterae.1
MSKGVHGTLTQKRQLTNYMSTCCSRVKELDAMGKPPDTPSGNYSRHLNSYIKKLDPSIPGEYVVPMPGFDRLENTRVVHNLKVMVAHELLAAELHDYEAKSLLAKYEAEEDPPAYWSHPVKIASEHVDVPTIPVALFLDGVEYSRNESLVGVSMTNLLTGRKFVLATIRKNNLRGSMWMLLRGMVQYVLRVRLPTMVLRVHGQWLYETTEGWGAEDVGRAAFAGQELGFRAFCLQLRGDLAEFCHGLGFTSWSSNLSPCILCTSSKQHWLEQIHLESTAMPMRRDSSYSEECGKCIVRVAMNQSLWANILKSLKNDSKSGGRTLTKDFASVGLRKGDRMEVSADHYDIWSCDMPLACNFWRLHPAMSPKRPNPMLKKELGTCLPQCLCLDLMHCWCLGIFQSFLMRAFWDLIEHKVIGGASRVESASLLNAHLVNWYRRFQKNPANENVSVTRLQGNLLDVLGKTPGANKFKAKAHQTLGLLRYICDALAEFAPSLPDSKWLLKVAHSYLGMYDALRKAPKLVPEATLQVSF